MYKPQKKYDLTAAQPVPVRKQVASPPVTEQEVVQIGVVALREASRASRTAALRSVFAELAQMGGCASRRLILLPGATRDWPQASVVREAAAGLDATVLFEIPWGGWHAHASDAGDLGVDVHQRFGTSAEANADPGLVDRLLEACEPGGERTLRLAGVDVGLLCCGENNVLANAQADGNRAYVRHHPGASLFDHVPVVFNGAHSNMGNWGKLDRRFELLARDRGWTMYATNNDRDRLSWGSAVRVYFDGELIADGNAVYRSPRGARLELVVDDQHDAFRALVVQAPGRMLLPRT